MRSMGSSKSQNHPPASAMLKALRAGKFQITNNIQYPKFQIAKVLKSFWLLVIVC